MIKKKLSNLIDKRAEAVLRKNQFIPINETFPQDIFIAGYPKAGLLFGIDTTYLPDRLTQELVPDVHYKKYYKRFLDFSCFKTHDLPKPEYKRVIHLVRDGRDAMVSYYHMHKASGGHFSLEEMVKEGKGVYPSKWHEHSQAWLDNPYHADIVRIRYEDLLTQPKLEMQKIADFMGISRSSQLIERVIAGNAFEKMKEKEKKFGWNNEQWNPEKDFIRKGKTGSYKEEMSEDLVAFFNKESNIELKQLSYAI